MFAEQPSSAPASLAAAATADLAPGLVLLQQPGEQQPGEQQPGETAGTQRPAPGRKGQSKGAAPAETEQGPKQLAAAASLEGDWSLSGGAAPSASQSAAPSASQHAASQPQGQSFMPTSQGRALMAGLRQDWLHGSRLAHSETAQCTVPAGTAARQLTQNGVKPPSQSRPEAAGPTAAKPSAAAANTPCSPPAAKKRRHLSSSDAPVAASNGARSGSKAASKTDRCGNLQGSAEAGSSPMKQKSKRQ